MTNRAIATTTTIRMMSGSSIELSEWVTDVQYTNRPPTRIIHVMLRPPEPVLVADLFPRERAGLLGVLDSLRPEDWGRPTVCDGWSVKDLVAHLLADDLGLLSRGRDGHTDAQRRAEE